MSPHTPAPQGRPELSMYGALALLGTLWGCSFSMAKVAAAGGGPSMGIALYASGIGAIILLAVTLGRRRRLVARRDYLRYYAMIGIIGVAAPATALYAAAAHVPAGVLSMLVATAPILTYGLAMGLAMERRQWRRIAGVALGFAGVGLLVLPGQAVVAGVEPWWLGVAFIAPVCYSFSTILGARFRPAGGDNIGLACGVLMCAAVILAAIAVPTGNTVSLAWPWNVSHLAILALGMISGFAFILFFFILARAGPIFFSQVNYVVTGTGVLWGMVLFGERHGALVWAALAVIVAGVVLVRPRPPDAEPGEPAA